MDWIVYVLLKACCVIKAKTSKEFLSYLVQIFNAAIFMRKKCNYETNAFLRKSDDDFQALGAILLYFNVWWKETNTWKETQACQDEYLVRSFSIVRHRIVSLS